MTTVLRCARRGPIPFANARPLAALPWLPPVLAGPSSDNRLDSWRDRYNFCNVHSEDQRLMTAQTETLLQQYSQFASISNLPPKPSEEEQSLTNQLSDILQRVRLRPYMADVLSPADPDTDSIVTARSNTHLPPTQSRLHNHLPLPTIRHRPRPQVLPPGPTSPDPQSAPLRPRTAELSNYRYAQSNQPPGLCAARHLRLPGGRPSLRRVGVYATGAGTD